MKSLWISVLISFISLSNSVQAAPPAPWLAVAEGSHSLSVSGCAATAARVMRQQGFARVTQMGSTVMGAYLSGKDYQFKAALKCQSSSAVAFVVTTLSGEGLNKANSLIAALRSGGGGDSMATDSDNFDNELPPLEELPLEDEGYDDYDDYVD